MNLSMYTIYDRKMKEYGKPFFAHSRGEALRSWQQAANDAQMPFAQFPDDYQLYCVGVFDCETAHYHEHVQPDYLGAAADYVVQPKLPLQAVSQ